MAMSKRWYEKTLSELASVADMNFDAYKVGVRDKTTNSIAYRVDQHDELWVADIIGKYAGNTSLADINEWEHAVLASFAGEWITWDRYKGNGKGNGMTSNTRKMQNKYGPKKHATPQRDQLLTENNNLKSEVSSLQHSLKQETARAEAYKDACEQIENRLLLPDFATAMVNVVNMRCLQSTRLAQEEEEQVKRLVKLFVEVYDAEFGTNTEIKFFNENGDF